MMPSPPYPQDKINAPFFENLRHCYLHPPDHQRHPRPSVIFVAQIVKPETFHSFLQLPRELRDIIYYHALRRPTDAELRVKPGRFRWQMQAAADDEMPIVRLSSPHVVDLWAGREEMSRLLRVNRQIHDEASEILYSAFTFTLLYADAEYFRHNLHPSCVRRVRRLAITVSLLWCASPSNRFDERCLSFLDMFAAMQSFEFRLLEAHFRLDQVDQSEKDRIVGYFTAIADRLRDRGTQLSITCSSSSRAAGDFVQELCRRVEAHVQKYDGSVGQL
ncbi:hypothetical protein FQN55_009505 [Onygenales sp. PD_40]|nr:hypothetical protein FQN55_009505 [Onygenales sp. PD_40]KAK2789646.1 hypothetical protein FQN52_005985 [Onygenales sp. PD_12]